MAQSHAARLSPRLVDADWDATLHDEVVCRRMEHELVERERAAIAPQVRRVPTDPTGFAAWFRGLQRTGPGQGDALFPWLAEQATVDDLCWFLHQEMAGEAGFDDLVALSQLKLAPRPKLEMARNYWDEMGQGHEGGMHGPMLQRLGDGLPDRDVAPVWQSLALGNLMVALATSRAYAYQSIGALGVIELTAPGRSELVNRALKRLRFDGAARRYYALHATLDVRHSETWIQEVLEPLVESDPRIAPLLAEGALMRLRAGARCFERYRAELMPSEGQGGLSVGAR
ncbi:MAG TPA: iron-containing redox enzyme family protein [Polyangiaceae bacterium]|nr:iron-containing redox enzyme family protein [Polyangiaceae bacterium]